MCGKHTREFICIFLHGKCIRVNLFVRIILFSERMMRFTVEYQLFVIVIFFPPFSYVNISAALFARIFEKNWLFRAPGPFTRATFAETNFQIRSRNCSTRLSSKRYDRGRRSPCDVPPPARRHHPSRGYWTVNRSARLRPGTGRSYLSAYTPISPLCRAVF